MTKNNTLIPVTNSIGLRTNIIYDKSIGIINIKDIKLISYHQMYSQIKKLKSFTKNISHLDLKYLLHKKNINNKYSIFSFIS